MDVRVRRKPPPAEPDAAGGSLEWRPTLIPFVAVGLCALSLRAPLTGLSPVASEVLNDLGGSVALVALVGAVGPFLLALAALSAGALMAWAPPEMLSMSALGLLTLAIIWRSSAWSAWSLVVASCIAYVAIGVLNAGLPAFIGRRFTADHIPFATAMYASLIAVGTALAPLIARWSVHVASWRLSSAIWGVVSLMAAVAFLAARLPKRSSDPLRVAAERRDVAPRRRPSRVVVSVTALMAVSAFNAFAMFALLPQILSVRFAAGAAEAALLLAIYAFMAVPAGLLTPLVLRDRSRFAAVAAFGVASTVAGYVMLFVDAPWAPWAAVISGGSGQLLYSAGLVLLTDMERKAHVSGVAGKVQGVAFALGAAGPLLANWLLHLDPRALALCLGFSLLPLLALLTLPCKNRP